MCLGVGLLSNLTPPVMMLTSCPVVQVALGQGEGSHQAEDSPLRPPEDHGQTHLGSGT